MQVQSALENQQGKKLMVAHGIQKILGDHFLNVVAQETITERYCKQLPCRNMSFDKITGYFKIKHGLHNSDQDKNFENGPFFFMILRILKTFAFNGTFSSGM